MEREMSLPLSFSRPCACLRRTCRIPPSYPRFAHRQEPGRAGADEVVTTPVNVDELRERLRRIARPAVERLLSTRRHQIRHVM